MKITEHVYQYSTEMKEKARLRHGPSRVSKRLLSGSVAAAHTITMEKEKEEVATAATTATAETGAAATTAAEAATARAATATAATGTSATKAAATGAGVEGINNVSMSVQERTDTSRDSNSSSYRVRTRSRIEAHCKKKHSSKHQHRSAHSNHRRDVVSIDHIENPHNEERDDEVAKDSSSALEITSDAESASQAPSKSDNDSHGSSRSSSRSISRRSSTTSCGSSSPPSGGEKTALNGGQRRHEEEEEQETLSEQPSISTTSSTVALSRSPCQQPPYYKQLQQQCGLYQKLLREQEEKNRRVLQTCMQFRRRAGCLVNSPPALCCGGAVLCVATSGRRSSSSSSCQSNGSDSATHIGGLDYDKSFDVRAFSTKSGKFLYACRGHTATITAILPFLPLNKTTYHHLVAFSAALCVTTSLDGTLRLWWVPARSLQPQQQQQQQQQHQHQQDQHQQQEQQQRHQHFVREMLLDSAQHERISSTDIAAAMSSQRREREKDLTVFNRSRSRHYIQRRGSSSSSNELLTVCLHTPIVGAAYAASTREIFLLLQLSPSGEEEEEKNEQQRRLMPPHTQRAEEKNRAAEGKASTRETFTNEDTYTTHKRHSCSDNSSSSGSSSRTEASCMPWCYGVCTLQLDAILASFEESRTLRQQVPSICLQRVESQMERAAAIAADERSVNVRQKNRGTSTIPSVERYLSEVSSTSTTPKKKRKRFANSSSSPPSSIPSVNNMSPQSYVSSSSSLSSTVACTSENGSVSEASTCVAASIIGDKDNNSQREAADVISMKATAAACGVSGGAAATELRRMQRTVSVRCLFRFTAVPAAFAVSNSGKYVAVACGKQVLLYSKHQARLLVLQHDQQLLQVAVHPEDQFVAAGDIRGRISLWFCLSPERFISTGVPIFSQRSKNTDNIFIRRTQQQYSQQQGKQKQKTSLDYQWAGEATAEAAGGKGADEVVEEEDEAENSNNNNCLPLQGELTQKQKKLKRINAAEYAEHFDSSLEEEEEEEEKSSLVSDSALITRFQNRLPCGWCGAAVAQAASAGAAAALHVATMSSNVSYNTPPLPPHIVGSNDSLSPAYTSSTMPPHTDSACDAACMTTSTAAVSVWSSVGAAAAFTAAADVLMQTYVAELRGLRPEDSFDGIPLVSLKYSHRRNITGRITQRTDNICKLQRQAVIAPDTVLHWHAHAVAALSFSADGLLLLSGGEEGVLVMWQLKHSFQKQFLPRLGAAILHISCNACAGERGQQRLPHYNYDREKNSSRYVAVSCADNSIKLIDTFYMRVGRVFQGLDMPISLFFFPPSDDLAVTVRRTSQATAAAAAAALLAAANTKAKETEEEKYDDDEEGIYERASKSKRKEYKTKVNLEETSASFFYKNKREKATTLPLVPGAGDDSDTASKTVANTVVQQQAIAYYTLAEELLRRQQEQDGLTNASSRCFLFPLSLSPYLYAAAASWGVHAYYSSYASSAAATNVARQQLKHMQKGGINSPWFMQQALHSDRNTCHFENANTYENSMQQQQKKEYETVDIRNGEGLLLVGTQGSRLQVYDSKTDRHLLHVMLRPHRMYTSRIDETFGDAWKTQQATADCCCSCIAAVETRECSAAFQGSKVLETTVLLNHKRNGKNNGKNISREKARMNRLDDELIYHPMQRSFCLSFWVYQHRTTTGVVAATADDNEEVPQTSGSFILKTCVEDCHVNDITALQPHTKEPRFFFTLSLDTTFKAWREVAPPPTGATSRSADQRPSGTPTNRSNSFFACIMEGSFRNMQPLCCALSSDASLMVISHGQLLTLWTPSSFDLLHMLPVPSATAAVAASANTASNTNTDTMTPTSTVSTASDSRKSDTDDECETCANNHVSSAVAPEDQNCSDRNSSNSNSSNSSNSNSNSSNSNRSSSNSSNRNNSNSNNSNSNSSSNGDRSSPCGHRNVHSSRSTMMTDNNTSKRSTSNSSSKNSNKGKNNRKNRQKAATFLCSNDKDKCQHIGLLEGPFGLHVVAATSTTVFIYDLLSLSLCWIKSFYHDEGALIDFLFVEPGQGHHFAVVLATMYSSNEHNNSGTDITSDSSALCVERTKYYDATTTAAAITHATTEVPPAAGGTTTSAVTCTGAGVNNAVVTIADLTTTTITTDAATATAATHVAGAAVVDDAAAVNTVAIEAVAAAAAAAAPATDTAGAGAAAATVTDDVLKESPILFEEGEPVHVVRIYSFQSVLKKSVGSVCMHPLLPLQPTVGGSFVEVSDAATSTAAAGKQQTPAYTGIAAATASTARGANQNVEELVTLSAENKQEVILSGGSFISSKAETDSINEGKIAPTCVVQQVRHQADEAVVAGCFLWPPPSSPMSPSPPATESKQVFSAELSERKEKDRDYHSLFVCPCLSSSTASLYDSCNTTLVLLTASFNLDTLRVKETVTSRSKQEEIAAPADVTDASTAVAIATDAAAIAAITIAETDAPIREATAADAAATAAAIPTDASTAALATDAATAALATDAATAAALAIVTDARGAVYEEKNTEEVQLVDDYLRMQVCGGEDDLQTNDEDGDVADVRNKKDQRLLQRLLQKRHRRSKESGRIQEATSHQEAGIPGASLATLFCRSTDASSANSSLRAATATAYGRGPQQQPLLLADSTAASHSAAPPSVLLKRFVDAIAERDFQGDLFLTSESLEAATQQERETTATAVAASEAEATAAAEVAAERKRQRRSKEKRPQRASRAVLTALAHQARDN